MHTCARCLFVVLISLATAPWCAASVIARIDPADQAQPVGQSFTVNIVADMTEPIVGWGLDLGYDHTVLSLVGAPAIGPLWISVFTPDGDGLAGVAFPTSVQGTNVLLATLHFNAIAKGQSDLTLSVTPGDLNEGFAADPAGFANVTYVPGHVTVTPEPAAALLLLGGIMLKKKC